MPDWHFYLLSHYICYGLMVLFSAFWLQKEWMQNSLWKEMGKRTEGRGLFWYCFRDAVKMISPAIIVYDKFTTILSQYIICSGGIFRMRDNSRMPRHSCCEMRVMQCMTYFFCASLQSCRRLYQMGDWLPHWYWFIAHHLQRWESSHIWYKSDFFNILENDNAFSFYCLFKERK